MTKPADPRGLPPRAASQRSLHDAATSPVGPDRRETIPVAAEHVVVSKELVDRARVKIAKTVETHDEIVDTVLLHDDIDVQRVPIGVYVTAPPPVRQEGETTVIPVLREVVVTYKALMVVEEVRVTRRQVHVQDRQVIPVRNERIVVDRTSVSPVPSGASRGERGDKQ